MHNAENKATLTLDYNMIESVQLTFDDLSVTLALHGHLLVDRLCTAKDDHFGLFDDRLLLCTMLSNFDSLEKPTLMGHLSISTLYTPTFYFM